MFPIFKCLYVDNNNYFFPHWGLSECGLVPNFTNFERYLYEKLDFHECLINSLKRLNISNVLFKILDLAKQVESIKA